VTKQKIVDENKPLKTIDIEHIANIFKNYSLTIFRIYIP